MDNNISDVATLKEYREKSRSGGYKDYRLTIRLLSFLRQSKLRSSRLVADAGYILSTQHFSKISDESEAYDILEQVILACLECNKPSQANELIQKLIKRFGEKSVRVQRLKAMHFECTNTNSSANEIYTQILDKYPADALSMKRQITILKSKAQYIQAISMLNTYLQVYMVDIEAWLELANLHMKLLSLKNALFCYEELILNIPINYVFYVKYAELIYSIGGADNYIVALKYYTHSLELNTPTDKDNANPTTNLSAIYGIIMSIYSYCNANGGGSSKLKESQIELYTWAQKQLEDITTQYLPQRLPIVKHFIQHTNINKST